MSESTSEQVSLPSDVSFVGSVDEGDDSLEPAEFYGMVLKEQEEMTATSQSRAFRWKSLQERLAPKHPYFASRSAEAIRSRYKYVKRHIKKIK